MQTSTFKKYPHNTLRIWRSSPSRLALSLLTYIFPICSLVVPRQTGVYDSIWSRYSVDISKKVLQGIGGMVLGTLVLMTGPVAQAATVFSDVPAGHWAEGYINDLVAKGIVNGANPTYRGNDKVQRDEMAQLIFKAGGFESKAIPLNLLTEVTAFKDVPKTAWSAEAIYTLLDQKVISGYTNQSGQPTGYYGPADSVTRGQVAKFIKNGFGWATDTSCAPVPGTVYSSLEQPAGFEDVHSDMWEYPYVYTLYAKKIVDGNMQGDFLMYRPGDNATRYEMSKIISNGLNPGDRQCGKKPFALGDITPIALDQVEICFTQEYELKTALNVANYVLTDDKGVKLTLSQVTASSDPMCVVLKTASQEPGKQYNLEVNNIMSKNGDTLNGAKQTFKAYVVAIDQADLSCLADTQPAAANVEKGMAGVDFLHITCTGPQSGSVAINSLTVTHYGSGNDADVSNVSLFADDVKVIGGGSVDNVAHTVKFSNLAYQITAGKTVKFVVKADVSANAVIGNDHGFKVMNPDDIENTATFFAGQPFPITGNLMKVVTPDQNNGGINNGNPGSIDVVAGSGSEVQLARFVLTSDLQDVKMRSVTFGVLDQSNGATLDHANLYTGSQCQTPVLALGGGNATGTPDIHGLLKFTNLDLTITEVGETPLCVNGVIKSVTSGGLPDSGDTVGIVLINIPEIFGGAGKNIAQKYMGTAVLNGGSPVTLTAAVDNANATMDLSGGFFLDDKQVYLMDQEQFYTVDSNATVLRGVGSSTSSGHAVGTPVYKSALEAPRTNISPANSADSTTDTCLELDSTANIEKGDLLILSYFESATPEYLLVKKVGASSITTHGNCIDSGTDNIEVVRGMFGSPVLDLTNLVTIAGVGEYTERGPVSSLWASIPVFRTTPKIGEPWAALQGGAGTGTQAILRFAIDAKGENGLNFENHDGNNDYSLGDDLIQVRLTGNVDNSGMAEHLSSCSLENVTPGTTETLDTVDLAGTSISAAGIDINFDFFSHKLQISPNGTAVLEVRCNMALISGESVAATIDTIPNGGLVNLDQTDLPTTTIIYSDGVNSTVAEDAENISGLKIIGPGFSGS